MAVFAALMILNVLLRLHALVQIAHVEKLRIFHIQVLQHVTPF